MALALAFRNRYTLLRNLYRQALRNYPAATQSVQVSILMAASDVIAQCGVEKTPVKEINWVRTGQFSGMGLFICGPILNYWYVKLDTVVNPKEKVWKRTLKKAAYDQVFFAPIFIGAFTVVLGLVQGLEPNVIKKRLETDYIDVMKTHYIMWPAAQIVNFALIPLNFQVVFAQSMAVLWNIYLSWALASDKKRISHVVI